MVFNSAAVVAVARASADTWQLCNPERLSSSELLDLLCSLPLLHLRRLALRLFSSFCLSVYISPTHHRRRQRYAYYHHSSSSDWSSSSDDDDSDDGGYASHSD